MPLGGKGSVNTLINFVTRSVHHSKSKLFSQRDCELVVVYIGE